MNTEIEEREIAGMPKRKENFAASYLFHPDINAVEIVIPDLDVPGISANDCQQPILKEFFKDQVISPNA